MSLEADNGGLAFDCTNDEEDNAGFLATAFFVVAPVEEVGEDEEEEEEEEDEDVVVEEESGLAASIETSDIFSFRTFGRGEGGRSPDACMRVFDGVFDGVVGVFVGVVGVFEGVVGVFVGVVGVEDEDEAFDGFEGAAGAVGETFDSAVEVVVAAILDGGEGVEPLFVVACFDNFETAREADLGRNAADFDGDAGKDLEEPDAARCAD